MGKFVISSHRTSCGTESKAFSKTKENTLTIFAPRSNHSSQVCWALIEAVVELYGFSYRQIDLCGFHPP